MRRKIIGHGTWLDKVAYELVEREKRLGRSLDLIGLRVDWELREYLMSGVWRTLLGLMV